MGRFGGSFTTGSTSTTYITIPGRVETQIVVTQKGSYTNEIAFKVTAPNGTVIYNRNSGTAFNGHTIFSIFCPLGGCPYIPTIDYYVTMTDSWGDGWNGNVLAFKQNGTLTNFALTGNNTRQFGPVKYTLQKKISTTIVVSVYGQWS